MTALASRIEEWTWNLKVSGLLAYGLVWFAIYRIAS